jgi:hypothetical protein
MNAKVRTAMVLSWWTGIVPGHSGDAEVAPLRPGNRTRDAGHPQPGFSAGGQKVVPAHRASR